MTPYEFTEINRKYNFQTTFNSKLKAMSKEEYEAMATLRELVNKEKSKEQ